MNRDDTPGVPPAPAMDPQRLREIAAAGVPPCGKSPCPPATSCNAPGCVGNTPAYPTLGVTVGTIGHVAPPGFGPATDALGVTPSDVPERTSSQKMADKGYTRRPRQIPPEGEDGVEGKTNG